MLSDLLCRGAAGNPRVPRLLPGTLGNFPGAGLPEDAIQAATQWGCSVGQDDPTQLPHVSDEWLWLLTGPHSPQVFHPSASLLERLHLCSQGFKRVEAVASRPLDPSPGDLPNPGIKLGAPALQVDSLPPEHPQLSLATRGEDWASQGQPKGKCQSSGS